MSFHHIPDPILHAYKEACRIDAANEWVHFMSYISGYKNAMLMYNPSPIRFEIASQMMFLYNMAYHRNHMAATVIRRN